MIARSRSLSDESFQELPAILNVVKVDVVDISGGCWGDYSKMRSDEVKVGIAQK